MNGLLERMPPSDFHAHEKNVARWERPSNAEKEGLVDDPTSESAQWDTNPRQEEIMVATQQGVNELSPPGFECRATRWYSLDGGSSTYLLLRLAMQYFQS